jgi:eukaryotic-like serine/threonine-protein kinase
VGNGAEDDRVARLSTTAGTALRASDPVQLGPYKLLRRLGEGGMGSVYLAEAADHTAVALKVIRTDLAEEPEFRRRFRSEVIRAQQVPPFCTAEVLDADPDHETPYLVVEYVDGPSLSDVVTERGPLTQANLYGLAIGVATALTAIHGAGVIHRDLKPSNVLLAPGTPKVIDFGIARATEGPDGETRTDQLMGTVAYMAPERLDPAVDGTLTPAADIFAWGAVVTYAATGHVPFGGDTSPATAIAILTQKPNLDGVSDPLRALVRRALAKKPASRPTARELLDELLSNAPRRALAGVAPAASTAVVGDKMPTAAVGDKMPTAANGAVAAAAGADVADRAVATTAGDVGRFGQGRPGEVTDEPTEANGSATEDIGGALTSGLALAFVDVTEDGGRPADSTPTAPAATILGSLPAPSAPEPVTAPFAGTAGAAPTVTVRPADATEHVALTGAVPGAPGGTRRRTRWRGVGIAVLVLCVLASAGAVAGILTGMIKLPKSGQAAGLSITTPPTSVTSPTSAPPSPSASPSPTPSPSASTAGQTTQFLYPAVYDRLTGENFWHPVDSKKYSASCLFGPSGMTVSLKDVTKTVSYRCSGPQDLIGDMQLAVNITFVNPGSCGAIWFRFVNNLQGYVLRVCSGGVELGTHIDSTLTRVDGRSFTPPLEDGMTTRIEIIADGKSLTVLRCDVSARGCVHPQKLFQASDGTFSTPGVVTLGMFEPVGAPDGVTYKVRFSDVQVLTPSAPLIPSPSASASTVTPPAVEMSSPPAPLPSGSS